MLTETYGGECPNCGYDRMMMRYGSHGYYMYDACPNCAFAFGTNEVDGEDAHGDFWDIYHFHDGSFLKKRNLQECLTDELLYIESLPETPSKKKSVFLYDDDLEARTYGDGK